MGIYQAKVALVDRAARRERSQSVTFTAENDLEAALSAKRALQRLARDSQDGYDTPGSIKLYSFLAPEVDETGYLRQSFGFERWEWKCDHDRGLPLSRKPQEFNGPVYEACVTFEATEDRPDLGEPYVLQFAAADDESAVADMQSWVRNRQKALPQWFGALSSIKVSALEPGPVADDGTVPGHATRAIELSAVIPPTRL